MVESEVRIGSYTSKRKKEKGEWSFIFAFCLLPFYLAKLPLPVLTIFLPEEKFISISATIH
jgi:hypothetical protein